MRLKTMTEVKYDLDLNSKPCRGVLRYKDGAVYALEDGKEVFSLSLKNIGELVQYTDVGCGSLEISPFAEKSGSVYDGAENITVCRFSMSAAEDIGEFCKAVNHRIKTGEEPERIADSADKCPVCGRRYPKGTDVCMFCVDKSYIWRRTFKMLRQFIPKLLLSSVLVTFANLMSAVQPVLQGKLVDGFSSAFSSDGLSVNQNIIFIGVAMALTYLLENIFQIFSGRTANSVGLGFSKYLRSVVYDRVQRMSVSSMSRKTAGDLIKRVTRDTNTVQNFFVDKGRYALEQLILFVVVGIFMLRMSPLLTLLAIIPAPFCIITLNSFKRYIHLRYDKQWRYDSRANSILHDIIRGIRVVKTFGSEKREVAKFSSVSKDLADISVKNERTWAVIFPVIGFLMNSGNFLVL